MNPFVVSILSVPCSSATASITQTDEATGQTSANIPSTRAIAMRPWTGYKSWMSAWRSSSAESRLPSIHATVRVIDSRRVEPLPGVLRAA